MPAVVLDGDRRQPALVVHHLPNSVSKPCDAVASSCKGPADSGCMGSSFWWSDETSPARHTREPESRIMPRGPPSETPLTSGHAAGRRSTAA